MKIGMQEHNSTLKQGVCGSKIDSAVRRSE